MGRLKRPSAWNRMNKKSDSNQEKKLYFTPDFDSIVESFGDIAVDNPLTANCNSRSVGDAEENNVTHGSLNSADSTEQISFDETLRKKLSEVQAKSKNNDTTVEQSGGGSNHSNAKKNSAQSTTHSKNASTQNGAQNKSKNNSSNNSNAKNGNGSTDASVSGTKKLFSNNEDLHDLSAQFALLGLARKNPEKILTTDLFLRNSLEEYLDGVDKEEEERKAAYAMSQNDQTDSIQQHKDEQLLQQKQQNHQQQPPNSKNNKKNSNKSNQNKNSNYITKNGNNNSSSSTNTNTNNTNSSTAVPVTNTQTANTTATKLNKSTGVHTIPDNFPLPRYKDESLSKTEKIKAIKEELISLFGFEIDPEKLKGKDLNSNTSLPSTNLLVLCVFNYVENPLGRTK